MTSYHDWLKSASYTLKQSGSSSAYLDAMLLLEHTIQKSSEYIKAYPEINLTNIQNRSVNKLLKRRSALEPMAYILNYKEFYARNFYVNQDVLIPRPESESIIDYLKLAVAQTHKTNLCIIDVGTGSGCLGITAKLIIPNAEVTLLDISAKALKVAQKNANRFNVRLSLIESDLFNCFKNKTCSFDVVIANLPYLDRTAPTSYEVQFEPSISLFAEEEGLFLIKKLLTQLNSVLSPFGFLVMEANPKSHAKIIKLAKDLAQLELLIKDKFVLLFKAQ